MWDFFLGVLSLAFIAQVLRITVPYALAAMGGVMSERSGVINIALEGILLMGAFTCAVAAHEVDLSSAYEADNIAIGALAGALGGVLTAGLYALAVIRFQADQIVAGVAINLLAYGLTRYLLKLIFNSTANSPSIPGFGSSILLNPTFWVVVLIGVGVYVLVTRTPSGLRLRAVGDHPEAADTLGVSVNAIRWKAVLTAGALAGLGGAWMALSINGFVAEMSGGRGYIALAAVIMGSWRPQWAVAACLLFGAAEAIQLQLEASNIEMIPNELTKTFPYVLTMIALAGFIGRSRPPAALGKPYESG
ncbi:MAG: ABC transporter permease [Haliangiales bacterium]